MTLVREIHDQLSNEIALLADEIDREIGVEKTTPDSRAKLREISNSLIEIEALLREEIRDESATSLVFSVGIRSKISALIKITQNGETTALTSKILELLNFPKNFLEGTKKIDIKQFELTPREREVLKLLPSGQRTKEMALTLFLTEATIKSHLASIFRKLKVNNRIQAISIAVDSGLVKR